MYFYDGILLNGHVCTCDKLTHYICIMSFFNFYPGAFILAYILIAILVGLPLIFLELALGQYSSLSQVKVWRLCPIAKGKGRNLIILTLVNVFTTFSVLPDRFLINFGICSLILPCVCDLMFCC